MDTKRILMLLTLVTMTSSAVAKSDVMDHSWNLVRNYRHAQPRDAQATSHLLEDDAVRKIQWSRNRPSCSPEDVLTKDDGHNYTTDDVLPRSASCPWYWVLNLDPRRTPRLIVEAHCACRRCISAGSDGSRCVPVHYFRPVKYTLGEAREGKEGEEGKDGKREISKLYRLPVGCVCQRSQIRQ